ncbi:hypothetical protein NQZ68_023071, partial [Dissostichus eleginoides]
METQQRCPGLIKDEQKIREMAQFHRSLPELKVTFTSGLCAVSAGKKSHKGIAPQQAVAHGIST